MNINRIYGSYRILPVRNKITINERTTDPCDNGNYTLLQSKKTGVPVKSTSHGFRTVYIKRGYNGGGGGGACPTVYLSYLSEVNERILARDMEDVC
jgi:hypothetical protein